MFLTRYKTNNTRQKDIINILNDTFHSTLTVMTLFTYYSWITIWTLDCLWQTLYLTLTQRFLIPSLKNSQRNHLMVHIWICMHKKTWFLPTWIHYNTYIQIFDTEWQAIGGYRQPKHCTREKTWNLLFFSYNYNK